MTAHENELIGKEWVDLSKEDLQHVATSPDLCVGGSGRIVWADPNRRAVVAVNLFGVLAEADAWVVRVSGVDRRAAANLTEAQARAHMDYPLLPHMDSVQLRNSSRWLRGGPRAKPHTRELLRRLKDDFDLQVCVIYPEIDTSWKVGVEKWLRQKGFYWDSLRPVPLGADIANYLKGCNTYIDNHPGRAARAREIKGIRKVSLVKNSWNTTTDAQRLTIHQVIRQHGKYE